MRYYTFIYMNSGRTKRLHEIRNNYSFLTDLRNYKAHHYKNYPISYSPFI